MRIITCPPKTTGGPSTTTGKAIASRNATTHGVFARDIVLTSLGEDPDGYQQVQDELVAQLRPANLLERHYVEKIAAASWRLRRLHRWQAQLFEDSTLTEDARLDKLDKVLRHETALQRQIDTAVRMLAKDVPTLYAGRARLQAMEDTQLCERECQDDADCEQSVSMQVSNRLYQIRKSTVQVVNELSVAALDPAPVEPDSADSENCQNELPDAPVRSFRLLKRGDSTVLKGRSDYYEALEFEAFLAEGDPPPPFYEPMPATAASRAYGVCLYRLAPRLHTAPPRSPVSSENCQNELPPAACPSP